MARPKSQAQQPTFRPVRLASQSEIKGNTVIWSPVWCAEHHFDNLESGTLCACQAGPQIIALNSDAYEILYGGERGGMKMQPDDAKVLTPKGWRRIGDLKIGDQVSDPTTGGHSKVIGVYPHGCQVIYRVTFDDGSSTEVGAEHLWAYKLSNRARPRTKKCGQRDFAKAELGRPDLVDRWNTLTVGNTADLIRAIGKGIKPRVPLTEPILFTVNGRAGSTLPAYLVGILLGDGSLTNIAISACEDGIREFLQRAGFKGGQLHTDGKPKEWYATGALRRTIDAWLRNHGLRRARSWEKFIPQYVFTAELQYRLDLLRGLMDTDGHVDTRGRCYYTTVSKRLADDVKALVWSLGGKVFTRETSPSFTHKGKKKAGRKAYLLLIQLPKTSAIFKLSRKRARCTDSWNGGHEIMRAIRSIKEIGTKSARCIKVSNPYGLYITDDYIVTHNSETLLQWILKGNPCEPLDCPVNISYINHEDYKVLIVRENEKDLADMIRRARIFYRPYGAEVTEKPARVRFPHPRIRGEYGATIVFGHMADESSYTDYIGQEFHRMAFEELTLIPNEARYLLIRASCRSKYVCTKGCKRAKMLPLGRMVSGRVYSAIGECRCGAIRPQIFITTNPGNVGNAWVKKRFVSIAPPRTLYTDPRDKLTRIFIPSKLEDNPYLMRDDLYRQNLESLAQVDPLKYRQWRKGDWDASAGQYFPHFRAKRLEEEPPEACHVIKQASRYLEPWLPRFGGCDWGHKHYAAVYGAVKDTNRQIILNREIVVSDVGTIELGVLIGRKFMPDLNAMAASRTKPHMNLYMSPDAFGERDAYLTQIELIGKGIERVLGPNSVYIPAIWHKVLDGHEQMTGKTGYEELDTAERAGITLLHAQNQRVAGWQYLRETMRWLPAVDLRPEQFNQERYDQLMHSDPIQAIRYRDSFERAKEEALPKMLIVEEECPILIESIPEAVHETKAGGVVTEDVQKRPGERSDDVLDAWRYTMHSQQVHEQREPQQFYVRRAVQDARKWMPRLDANDMVWIARAAEQEYGAQDADMEPFSIRAASSWRGTVN